MGPTSKGRGGKWGTGREWGKGKGDGGRGRGRWEGIAPTPFRNPKYATDYKL